MNDSLAEALLAKVMSWKSPEDFIENGLPLQDLAEYKYDEYQRFSPGMRFVESLAMWLGQFKTIEQRRTALKFVRDRLVFVSSSEMNHFVSIAYPDHIQPFLLSKAALESGLPEWHRSKTANTCKFQTRERRCLFLGLSDGAHTDVLRRTSPHLQNEQVRQSHELSDERINDLLSELSKELAKILGREPTPDETMFRSVVLLDDFSASGVSYIRKKPDGTTVGKVGKFFSILRDHSKRLRDLFVPNGLEVILVLYMATETAERALSENLAQLCSECKCESRVMIVQRFPESQRIVRGTIPDFDRLIDLHYDSDNETTSTKLGGTDLKFGFAGGGLPLILSHNAPNNSIGLLWAEGSKMRPLFPRVTRHKDL